MAGSMNSRSDVRCGESRHRKRVSGDESVVSILMRRIFLSATPNSTVYDSIIKNPKAAIEKMIDSLQSEYIDEQYAFDGICDYDAFISAVSQTVKSKNIDLIVMGTNGATGATEVIFGSNTINVIRNINCPVLAIRRRPSKCCS